MVELTLRPYQQLAVDRIFEKKKGIVELPTGSGKTIIAIGFLQQLINKGYDVRSLALTPTRALVHQWREVARKYLPETQRPVVTTYNYFIRNYTRIPLFQHGFGKNEVRVLFIDEVHHAHDNTKLLDAIISSGAINFDYVIGFTATLYPDMAYDGLNVIFNEPPGKLVKLGYIPPFQFELRPVNLKPYDEVMLLKAKRAIAEYSNRLERATDENEIKRLRMRRDLAIFAMQNAVAMDENVLEKTIESALELNPPKIVGDTVTFEGYVLILTLRKVAALYIERGLMNRIKDMTGKDLPDVVLYYEFTSSEEEEKIKRKLKEMRWHFLIAVKRLSEGIDIPELTGEVLSSYSTTHTVTVRQMIGRLTRMTAKKEKEPPRVIALAPTVEIDKYTLFWDKVLEEYN